MCDYQDKMAVAGFDLAGKLNDELEEATETINQAVRIIAGLLVLCDNNNPDQFISIGKAFIEQYQPKPVNYTGYDISRTPDDNDLPF